MKKEIKELYFYNKLEEANFNSHVILVDTNDNRFELEVPIYRTDILEIVKIIRNDEHPDLKEVKEGMKVYHKRPSFEQKYINTKPDSLIEAYLKYTERRNK